MKRILIIAMVFIGAFSCTQRPKITSDADVTGIRPAIAIEYVAVPTMTVFASPDVNAQPVGSYGFSETISILVKKGDWCEIRTYDGTGWVKAADLMTADQEKAASANPAPRFYVPPVAVPYGGHGEVVLQAKVNTAGEVYEVTQMSASVTAQVADANAAALRQAKFYPLVDHGQRKTFIYEHRVVY